MKKVYINQAPVRGPYGGGNHFVKAFHKHIEEFDLGLVRPDDMLTPPDVILLTALGASPEGNGISASHAIQYKNFSRTTGHDVKLVLRVNENDARKATSHVDRALLQIAEHVDKTIFVSEWLRGYFHTKGWPRIDDSSVVINGVDHDVFKPSVEKLNNGKVNIVTHHWSNNSLKGFDIYNALDVFVGKNSDRFSFTYIGRDQGTFKHTQVIRPLHGKQLGETLAKYDVYVSASRFDPGPNHISEALSCGLPTFVHVDGGGCVEFANDHVYSSWEQLMNILDHSVDTIKRPNTSRVFATWQECVGSYANIIKSL